MQTLGRLDLLRANRSLSGTAAWPTSEPPFQASPYPPPSTVASAAEDKPLTIAEAKRRLALTFGVSEASIKISVEA